MAAALTSLAADGVRPRGRRTYAEAGIRGSLTGPYMLWCHPFTTTTHTTYVVESPVKLHTLHMELWKHMTNRQRLEIEAHIALQNEINALPEIRSDTPDVETRLAERNAKVAQLAKLGEQLAAAIESESTPTDSTPESREWSALNDRFDLGAMFGNVIEHRVSAGEIAEVQSERGLAANAVPTELLMEHRAVTPAPADVGQTQNGIEGFVFPQSAAAFLGIPSPIVPVGDTTFPVLTSDPAAGTPAENDPQTETTGAFTADVLTPGRIQASFFWSREDAGRMAGMGDALRDALAGGLAEKLDQQIMGGTNGLFTGTNLANHARGAASDYAHYVAELLYGRVDGRYAGDLADIRVVMGSDTFANAATKLPTNGEVNALARIRNDSAGVRVSAHVPDASGNKQNAVVRLGQRRDMVAPLWGGVTLIPDEITKAANGQIVLTAVLLHAVKILRSGGFYKQETNHS